MTYFQKLEAKVQTGVIPSEIAKTLHPFYLSYVSAAKSNGQESSTYEPLLLKFLDLVEEQIKKPFAFEPYHRHITSPFDYYRFGLDFVRPLVIQEKSTILHEKNLNQIAQQLKNHDNVIFLANHQTELDPQAISLLLEKKHPNIGKEMIFVAGHRVISDPLAIPFSKGRNLLCIFSKKYIDDDPDNKEEKRLHNQRTMLQMSQLLSEGGKCIYVAPSGGRDRINQNGIVEVAAFDPQSIEMFNLMAQRAEHPTHFYPLALDTYHLMPPPEGVTKTLGEPRYTKATAIHAAFGNEIDMENFEGSTSSLSKKDKRIARAKHIWQQVKKDYHLLLGS